MNTNLNQIDTRPPLFRFDAGLLDIMGVDESFRIVHDLDKIDAIPYPFDIFCIKTNASFFCKYYEKSYDISMPNSKKILDCVIGFFVIDKEKKEIKIVRDKSFLVFKDGSSESGDDILSKYGEKRFSYFFNYLGSLPIILFASLSIKNVKKEVEQIAFVRGRRKPAAITNYSSVTTLKIGAITETHRGSGNTGSPVVPHLRRGHIREQRVGKGLSETKRIYIQPCFVNADKEWIEMQQKEYRVTK